MGYTHFDKLSANVIATGRKGSELPFARGNSSRVYCRGLKRGVVALSDANTTLTVAQVLDSGLFTINPTAARTITTPTAANIVAGIPNAEVGDSFTITIVNSSATNGVTLAGGTGVTISGSASVTNGSMSFTGVVTNVTAGSEAVTMVRM